MAGDLSLQPASGQQLRGSPEDASRAPCGRSGISSGNRERRSPIRSFRARRRRRREGRRVALAPRPLQVLVILARRPGQLVSRHELRREVWKDAWIDVESSINTAIRELRRALGDQPTASGYIATS